jgi:hypothetical protein
MDGKPLSDNAKVKVDIGIACNVMQSYQWSTGIMNLLINEERNNGIYINAVRAVGSALPDHNRNAVICDTYKRNHLTDSNRSEVTRGFLSGDADWLFWIDDDTVPPIDAISRLLKSGRDFIAGLYFQPAPPFAPIAYRRREIDGLYYPVYDYNEGALIKVDSVGMGCTLIHRSVYQRIIDSFDVFIKRNGSVQVVRKDLVLGDKVEKHKVIKEPYVEDGIYHEQYSVATEDDHRQFPFYLLEYGRTEDYHFCELANQIGIYPWLDTTVVCDHWKLNPFNDKNYKQELEEAQGLR